MNIQQALNESKHWHLAALTPSMAEGVQALIDFAKSMQWRPIDDASKDGMPVYVLEADGTQGTARWDGEWTSTGCIDDWLTYKPTHFAPLLPAPKGDV